MGTSFNWAINGTKMSRIFLALLLVSVCPSVRSANCVGDGACKCTFDDGSGTVDISSIGKQDGSALAQDEFAADNYAYSYNPCYPFTEGTCVNAAACQYDAANVIYYNIGDSANVVFSYDGLNVIADYKADDGQRSSKVTLVCDPSADPANVQVQGETSPGNYEFTVTSKAACPTGGDGPGPGPGPSGGVTVSASISGGSILVIIFFSVVVVYFIAGTAFMKFGKHQTGKEVVPNIAFWISLPGLVKDGFGFVIGKTCRRSGYSRA